MLAYILAINNVQLVRKRLVSRSCGYKRLKVNFEILLELSFFVTSYQ